MSGLAAPAARPPQVRPPAPAASARSGAGASDALAPWLRLAAFAGLAGFASAYWVSFVANAPGGRVLLVLLIACSLGALLIVLGRLPVPRPAAHAAAALLTLAALGLALVAMGLDASLLKPARWDDFGALLDRGFAGLRTIAWPYDGRDQYVRLTILLAVAPVLVAAAALAFWPVRKRPGFDAVALVLLVVFYAVAITDQDFGGSVGRGLVLLVLIAAWLWLPQLGRGHAAGAAVAFGIAALFAMPVAVALDGRAPWIDYNSWAIGRNPGHSAAFDWNHRYGPIDWPRSGRTLLAVQSDKPHYWKAETLDDFDGLRWLHTRAGEHRLVTAEMPQVINPAWDERITFTVRELRSDLVVGAGTVYSSDIRGAMVTSGDGTTRLVDRPLQEGDTYLVRAYVPDPTADQMRAAPDAWSDDLGQYVAFSLPRPGEDALAVRPGESSRPEALSQRVALPFRGARPDRETALDLRMIRRSPYARLYRLATRLARNQPTTYDVVRTTENYLQSHMRYQERVPSRRYPLTDFVFRDKAGYCQQFSGAMALMLRMNGIPARVAGGFAPGIYDQATKEFRVRDLDAHSWVEVYFADIGWVPFDPTPTQSPAGSQSAGSTNPSAARGGQDRVTSLGTDSSAGPASGGSGSSGGGDGSTRIWMLPVLLLPVAVLGLAGLWIYSVLHQRRHRRATPADAQLAELQSALERLGHRVPPKTTLTALERRLGKMVGPAAARYVGELRDRIYGPPGAPAPSRADRAALRRELAAAAGPLGRVRALLALPPRAHRPN
jgi:transglutaminase-like putative cysteine protease